MKSNHQQKQQSQSSQILENSARRSKMQSIMSELNQINQGISLAVTQNPQSNVQNIIDQENSQYNSMKDHQRNVSIPEFDENIYDSNTLQQSKQIQQSYLQLESPTKQGQDQLRRFSNQEQIEELLKIRSAILEQENKEIEQDKLLLNVEQDKQNDEQQQDQQLQQMQPLSSKQESNNIEGEQKIKGLQYDSILDILRKYNKNELQIISNKGNKSRDLAVLEFDKVSTTIFQLQQTNPSYHPILKEQENESDEFWRKFDLENNITQIQTDNTNHRASINFNDKLDIKLPKLKTFNIKKNIPKKEQPLAIQIEDPSYFTKDPAQKKKIMEQQNEILKQQYIDIVKSKKENEHLTYLLGDPQQKSNLTKQRIKEIQQQFQDDKKDQKEPMKFKDTLFTRDLEPLKIYSMKESLLKINDTKKRNRNLLALSGNFESVKSIYTKKRESSPTKDQMLQTIRERGAKLSQRISLVNLKKDIIFEQKLQRLKEDQKKKERMLANYEALELNRRKDYNRKLFKLISVLNLERWLQYIQYTAQEGLILRRNMFKIHMKVRVIQNAVRTYLIHKHVMQRMNQRVEIFFKDVIFKYKIRRNINRKRNACRKILFNLFLNSLKTKVKYQLMIIRRSIRNIQKFAVWTMKQMTWQISQISQQWDLYTSNMLKITDPEVLQLARRGAVSETPAHNTKLSQFNTIAALGDQINEKQQTNNYKQKVDFDTNNFISFKDFKNYMNLKSRILKMNMRLGAQKIEKEEFKVIPSYVPTTYDMKNSVLQQNFTKMLSISEKIQQVMSFDKHSEQSNTSRSRAQESFDIFLPFTVHNSKIQLGQMYRIKYESEHIHQKIYLRAIEEEIKIKYELIKELIQLQRKAYIEDIKTYYDQLRMFIEKNKQEVNLERTQLMLKTNALKLKHFQLQEDYQYTLQEKRKKKGIKLKQVFQKDHLPFSSIVMEIASKMQNAPKRPKLKIKFTMKMFEEFYFKSYYTKFVQSYTRMAVEQRLRSLSQNQKNKQHKDSIMNRDEEQFNDDY